MYDRPEDETTKQASFSGSFVRDDAGVPMLLSHKAQLVVQNGPDRGLARGGNLVLRARLTTWPILR